MQASQWLVVNLHGVGEPGRAIDHDESPYWLTHQALERTLDAVAGRQDVRITFDDGNRSDVELALPALVRRGLTATFFPLAGKLGQPGYMTVSGIRELVAHGMAIGSHGMRHRSWRRMDPVTAREELVTARAVLEEAAERRVVEAACPFGAYDRAALRGLRDAGYRKVFTSDGGRSRPDRWLTARCTLTAEGPAVAELLAARPGPKVGRAVRLAAKRWR